MPHTRTGRRLEVIRGRYLEEKVQYFNAKDGYGLEADLWKTISEAESPSRCFYG